MGDTIGDDWIRINYIFVIIMKHEFTVKTNCPSCLGIIGVFIEKIPGVKSVEYDEKTGKITTEYEGGLSKNGLAKIIEEKIGYKLE